MQSHAVNEFETSVATKYQNCSRLPTGGEKRVPAKDLYQSTVYPLTLNVQLSLCHIFVCLFVCFFVFFF